MTPQDQQLIEGLIVRARPLASPPDSRRGAAAGREARGRARARRCPGPPRGPARGLARRRAAAPLRSAGTRERRFSSSVAPPPASSAARPRPRRDRLPPLRHSPLRPPSAQARRRTRPTLVTPSSPQRRPGPVAVEAAGSCAARPRRRPALPAACWRPRRSKGWPTSSSRGPAPPRRLLRRLDPARRHGARGGDRQQLLRRPASGRRHIPG